jgi:hypothetical protein
MSITAIPNSTFTQPLSASNKIYQQDFAQLGQDLRSSNLSSAQQDYTALQQHLQKGADPGPKLHRHIHHGGGDFPAPDQNTSQLLAQLGQDLSSGSISAAERAYSQLLAQLPQSPIGAQPGIEPSIQASPVSVNA